MGIMIMHMICGSLYSRGGKCRSLFLVGDWGLFLYADGGVERGGAR